MLGGVRCQHRWGGACLALPKAVRVFFRAVCGVFFHSAHGCLRASGEAAMMCAFHRVSGRNSVGGGACELGFVRFFRNGVCGVRG